MTIRGEIGGPAVQAYERACDLTAAAGRVAVAEWYAQQVDPEWFDNQISLLEQRRLAEALLIA